MEQLGFKFDMAHDLKIRSSIVTFQQMAEHGIDEGILEDASDQMLLEHFFTPISEEYGCAQYARQLFMPAGTVVIGKLHRLPHITFLMKGRVLVVSENGGKQDLTGPLTFISPAGSKRVFHVIEDTLLTTVHLTKQNTEDDLPNIEDEVISPTYSAMGLEEPDTDGITAYLDGLSE